MGASRLIWGGLALAFLALPAPARSSDTRATELNRSLLSLLDLKSDSGLTRFMDDLDRGWREKELHTRLCEVEDPGADSCDTGRSNQQLMEFLATPEYVDVVWRLRKGVKNPALRARMDAALPAMLGAVFDQDPSLRRILDPIADTTAFFRPEVGGIVVTREQAREIMRRDEDRARRRAAYESGGVLSQKIGPDLRELFRQRNVLAQRFGYSNYVDLKLSAEHLRAGEVEALEDSLERLTRAPYRELLSRIRARLGVFQLHAWDLVYGQSVLDEPRDTSLKGGDAGVRLGSFIAGMGQNPDVLPIRLVFQAGPQFRTRCVPVDPPRDIRLILNPSNSLGGYTSLFHEYGVALLEASLLDSRPSLRAVPEVWREAMGDLFGNFSVEADWLGGGLNLPDSVVARYRSDWLHARLLSLRTLLLLSRFERTVYLSPRVNPDTLWRGLSERYLEVEASDPSLWASETPLLVRPLGFTRYLVAQAISSQLLRTVRARCGRAEGGCLGDFMRDQVWKPGETTPWEKILETATGAPWSARAQARELGAP